MSKYKTPEDAATTTLCPLSMISDERGKRSFAACQGDRCAYWRWKPRSSTDPELVSATKRTMAEMAQADAKATGKPAKAAVSYHKAAVAQVMKNPDGYAPQEAGYCGGGGPVT